MTRQETDAALERLNQTLEQAIDAVVSIDQDNRVTFFNAAAEKLWGVSRGEVLGRNVSMLIPIAHRGEHDALIDANRETGIDRIVGTSRDVELVRLDDGRVTSVNLALSKIRLGDGITYTAFLKDMSRQRALEAQSRERQELARLNARFQRVLDTATNGVVALDAGGRIQLANPVARHMLGGIAALTPFDWPAEIRFLNPLDTKPIAEAESPVARALGGDTLRREMCLMTRANGAVHRYVRVSSAAIAGDDPELAAVIVFDDVTNEEINRQQIERRGRLEALGQLTGGIAHDFNNMLATIRYSVELALLKPLDAKTEGYLTSTLTAVKRGADLTGRLLSFAKRQPGRASSRLTREILIDLLALAGSTIERSIEIETDPGEDGLFVFCDQGQLENALLNLVINSRDAIKSSGRGDLIRVVCRGVADISSAMTMRGDMADTYVSPGVTSEKDADDRRDDQRAYRYVEISVTDNGPGMTEEVKRRAIDPFFTTKETSSGTGLGLSMVYGFVQQAGGELRIYSEPGQGATVRLLLPRGTPVGEREAPTDRLSIVSGAGERVLVVEDEPFLLATFREVLETIGYEVTTASSGREALALVEGGLTVDLLLTDVVMPGGIGGFDLAARLRERLPDLPIVYMSGYTGFSREEMGVVTAPILSKPFEPREFAEALREALGAGRAPTSPGAGGA